MKKALSIVLSVAMLMTALAAMFVTPVSAAGLTDPIIELMNPDYIVEGAENVTVNADGTWTITGPFAMRCDINYDVNVVQNIKQNLTTNTPVKITVYDQPYDKWLGLYDNWIGDSHYPVGTYNDNNGMYGIYNWNVDKAGWDSSVFTNGANVSAIYFEFDGTEGIEMTLKDLYLNDGTLKPDIIDFGPAEFEYDTTYDLTFKTASDMWSPIPVFGSRPIVNVTDDALTIGNTAANYPSAYIDFDEPVVINEEAMVHCDFDVHDKSKTTIYLFFGEATCNEFDNGAYGVVHNALGAEIGYGKYSGYISVKDFLPTDPDALAACYNADGELVVTGIKIFATSATEAAVDPAITLRTLELCYTEAEDVLLGDWDGNGTTNMRDIMQMYKAVSEGNEMTDAQFACADYDGNGTVNMRDVMKIYQIVSGAI